MGMLTYLLIQCHRANILTIRNIKGIPLGECNFSAHGLQFDNVSGRIHFCAVSCKFTRKHIFTKLLKKT